MGVKAACPYELSTSGAQTFGGDTDAFLIIWIFLQN